MKPNYPRIGSVWHDEREARRYGFLLSHESSPPHYHKYFELGYIVRGSIKHSFMGTVNLLKPGDMFFIDITVIHSYEAAPDTDVLNFMFYPEVLDPSYKLMSNLSQIAGSPTFRFNANKLPLLNQPFFHDEDGSFLRHLEELQMEIQQKKPGHHQMERTMIQQLIIRLMRLDNTVQHEITADQPLAQKLQDILDTEHPANISMQNVCKKLNYSPAHISRTFRKLYGVTFTAYLQKLKLAQSCRLLLETDLSVEQVAESVGYKNVQFFHRIFREHYQLSPLQYRKTGKHNKKTPL